MTMKTAMLAVLAAVTMLTGCAAAAPRKTSAASASIVCQEKPQWFINDKDGNATQEVFICFGADGHLMYNARPVVGLAPESKASAAASIASAPKKKRRGISQPQSVKSETPK